MRTHSVLHVPNSLSAAVQNPAVPVQQAARDRGRRHQRLCLQHPGEQLCKLLRQRASELVAAL